MPFRTILCKKPSGNIVGKGGNAGYPYYPFPSFISFFGPFILLSAVAINLAKSKML